jgi:hypothetical protein
MGNRIDRRGFLEACVAGAAGVVGCGGPSRDDIVRDQYADIREVLGTEYNPDYHPDIADYEEHLEQEISPWLPSFEEFERGFDGPKNGILRSKANHIRANPGIMEDNEHYMRFASQLDQNYKHPQEKGFLGFETVSLSELLENTEGLENLNEGLSKNFGFRIDLHNPSRADKAMFFLMYIQNEKEVKVNKSYENPEELPIQLSESFSISNVEGPLGDFHESSYVLWKDQDTGMQFFNGSFFEKDLFMGMVHPTKCYLFRNERIPSNLDEAAISLDEDTLTVFTPHGKRSPGIIFYTENPYIEVDPENNFVMIQAIGYKRHSTLKVKKTSKGPEIDIRGFFRVIDGNLGVAIGEQGECITYPAKSVVLQRHDRVIPFDLSFTKKIPLTINMGNGVDFEVIDEEMISYSGRTVLSETQDPTINY